MRDERNVYKTKLKLQFRYATDSRNADSRWREEVSHSLSI